ncbi:MAG: heparan N-sulfatase, partial [Planctomycetales bacterium]
MPVLLGRKSEHRKHAYGVHNNIPEGPSYPIRTVSDGDYRYIRNLKPDEIYIEKHLMGGGALNNPYWATWTSSAWNNPRTYHLVKRYMRRPKE